VIAERIQGDMLPEADQCSSLFWGALTHLSLLIQLFRPGWAELPPSNGVLDLEATGSFHRLWSALSFLFGIQSSRYADTQSYSADSNQTVSRDHPAQNTLTAAISDEYQFGHGFFMAGAALIQLLGQKAQFCALDFSTHVLRVEAYEKAAATRAEGVGLADVTLREEASSFVLLKARHSQLYSIAFCILDTHTQPQQRRSTVLYFHPPDNYDK